LAEEPDELARLEKQTLKFLDGKAYEEGMEELIQKGDTKYLQKIADEAGITLEELKEYRPLSQVQIRIPDTNGGFTTMDNVWVKKIESSEGTYLEVIVNEPKLSKDSPFSKRQLQFEKALDNPESYFDLRNTKFKKDFDIKQNTEIRVKAYIKTIGEGGSPPDISKFNVTRIK
jgi:hypothetical protein